MKRELQKLLRAIKKLYPTGTSFRVGVTIGSDGETEWSGVIHSPDFMGRCVGNWRGTSPEDMLEKLKEEIDDEKSKMAIFN
jgi:hypothetical protein